MLRDRFNGARVNLPIAPSLRFSKHGGKFAGSVGNTLKLSFRGQVVHGNGENMRKSQSDGCNPSQNPPCNKMLEFCCKDSGENGCENQALTVCFVTTFSR